MNSSKKLIYIANLRLPTERAYGIQIAKMCEAFAEYNQNDTNEYSNAPNVGNIEVELVAPYRQSKIKDNLFDYYSVKRNFKFRIVWAPDFYWPDKLDRIAVNIKSFISAVVLCFYALTHKSEVIYTRDEWPVYFLSFFKKNVIFETHKFSSNKKLFYRRFKLEGIKIIVISNGLKSDFVSFGFTENNLLVAPDGVDLEEFERVEADLYRFIKLQKLTCNDLRISARKLLGLPQDKKIVMYTGHLFEWKGADTLLQAAKLISNFEFSRRRFPCETGNLCRISNPKEMLFVFVGGTEYDAKEFREKAKGLDNVLILGHKPHKEVPIYLKAADVLVLPNSAKEEISNKYTSPLKLFEYMASGRPIIASDLESVREVLNEKNAYFFKADDSTSLAEVAGMILDNKIDTEKKALAALEDVKEYTWQKRAASILNFLR